MLITLENLSEKHSQLTERQLTALFCMINFLIEYQRLPNVSELARLLGVTANAAQEQIVALEKKKVVERLRSPVSSRNSYRLTDAEIIIRLSGEAAPSA